MECLRKFGPNYANFNFAASEAALNIAFTYDILHQCMSRYMSDIGLSKSAFNVLMLLRHAPPEGMQLHDLGELLLVSRANVTGLVSHLEGRGYVTRQVDEQDRRARFARITPKAQHLLDNFIPLHYENLNALMSDLSSSDKHELVRLLGRVRNSIKGNAGACEKPVEVKA